MQRSSSSSSTDCCSRAEPDVVGARDRDAVRRAHVDAETAEDAQLGREHDVVEAAQAAQPFEAGLLLVVAGLDLAEADPPIGRRRRDRLGAGSRRSRCRAAGSPVRSSTRTSCVAVGRRAPVSARVDRRRGAPAVGDRVDQVPRAAGDVAAGPDARVGGAQRRRDRPARRPRGVRSSVDAGVEEAHVGGLPDREDDGVGRRSPLRCRARRSARSVRRRRTPTSTAIVSSPVTASSPTKRCGPRR